MDDRDYIIGIDLGGTKIAAAAFDRNHKRLGKVQSIPTMARQPTALTLMNLKRVVGQARRGAELRGTERRGTEFKDAPLAIGMGSPGPLDTQKGLLLQIDTLPNLSNFNMSGFVEAELGAPLFLENDANCFALAEALAGAGREHSIVAGLTLGTGFGCGIVVDGQIQTGARGNAGEVSHCRVAGGTFDEMLSGSGVQRLYQRIAGKEAPPPKELGKMAEEGDTDAIATWEAYGAALGQGIGMICAVVDPSICVVGGSVARRFSLFQASLEREMRPWLCSPSAEEIQVVPAQLDNTAGVTGAAEYAFLHLGRAER